MQKFIRVIGILFVIILLIITGCSNGNNSGINYCTIGGIVKCSDTDKTLAEVYIEIGKKSTTSDTEGVWQIKDILAGEYELIATKAGYNIYSDNVLIKEKSTYDITMEKKYNLNINTQGEGNVTVAPDKESYNYGDEVMLIATPNEGWKFIEWQGAACETTNSVTLCITENTDITAVFQRKDYNLTVNVDGNGQVEEEVLSIPQSTHSYETVLQLIAVPEDGWRFVEWQGDKTGSDNPTTVTMDSAMNITAVFEIEEYIINISTQGEGNVTIEPDKETYNYGDEVTLTAVAYEGWLFNQWDGDILSNNETISIIIDSSKTISAIFKEDSSISGNIEIGHNFPDSVVTQFNNDNTSTKLIEDNCLYTTNITGEDYKREELIIRFSSYISRADREKTLLNMGYKIQDEISSLNAYLVTVSEEIQEERYMALTGTGIIYAEPNYKAKTLYNNYPNDNYYEFQWHYPLIRLPQAWSITTGNDTVRIAVIDSGVGPHVDLESNIDDNYGYNFVSDSSNYQDDNGHGTHVAGTIGAETNNCQGVAGIMWDVDILPIKVLGADGSGTNWDVAKGILYAAGLLDNPYNPYPADIINLSLGSTFESSIVTDAIEESVNNTNVIIVAAAGNKNSSIIYPAALPEVIAVGAVDYNYPNAPQKAPYSNYGSQLDIVAPGGNLNVDTDGDSNNDGVLSTMENFYYYLQGTSMATPHISGVIGLMLSNGIPSYQVREILHKTSIDLGFEGRDSYYGYGLVNAYWAVNNVDKLKVIVGTLAEDTINVVIKTEISPRGGEYNISNIPAGEYRVFAWIDVRDNNIIEPGDYFGMSELYCFSEGKSYVFNDVITELDSTEIPLQLNN